MRLQNEQNPQIRWPTISKEQEETSKRETREAGGDAHYTSFGGEVPHQA